MSWRMVEPVFNFFAACTPGTIAWLQAITHPMRYLPVPGELAQNALANKAICIDISQ